MFKRSVVSRLLFCTLVSLPVSVFAASTITISSPSCDGNYLVQGNLQGVAGVDLTIGYNPATLANPRVNWGGLVTGMNSAANPVNPIRMMSVGTKAITGSGTVATITFDKVGAAAGQITSFATKMIDEHASYVTAQAIIVPGSCGNAGNDSGNQSDSGDRGGSPSTNPPAVTPTTPASTATTQTTVPGYLPYVVGGTVTLPSAEQGTDNKQAASQPAPQPASPESYERPVPQASAPAYQPREDAPAPKAAEEPAPAPKRVPSVLEKFQLYNGEKTVKNLTGLFDRDSDAIFSQAPAIVIADGKSTAKVSIRRVRGESAPNFAFTSAHYVSLARSADGGWEIEVLPDKDAVTASVTVLMNGVVQEIPLAVAPKAAIGKGGQPTEADFQLFLKERGTPTAPKYDLNGDGKRDYIDDYIFTANYLVKSDKQVQQKK